MGREAKFRKTLSMPGLLAQMRRCFEGVEDEVAGRGLSLADCLMSGLAIFSLKYPSLLQFEQGRPGCGGVGARAAAGRTCAVCSGWSGRRRTVRLRERLDEVDPRELRAPFKRLFARAQRGGGAGGVRVAGGSVLAVGGRHGALLVVEGALRELLREASQGRDDDVLPSIAVRGAGPSAAPGGGAGGGAGGDSEVGWAEEERLREESGEASVDGGCGVSTAHLALVVVEDGLGSNGPHIRLLKELEMRFVLGAKPGDHKALLGVGGRIRRRTRRGGWWVWGDGGRRRHDALLSVAQRCGAQRHAL